MKRIKRVLMLINRSAGMGKAGNDIIDIVAKYAAAGYEPVVYPIIPGTKMSSEVIISKYEEDFADVAELSENPEACRGKITTVLCSGGDGTLNHVMNALMGCKKKPYLAYIPSGSTNDFAKGLGISANHAKAIETAVSGKPYAYDVGKMNDNYFNYVAAFGAFSKMSYATDQELKNVLGYAAYIISAIAELPQTISYSCHMSIEADDLKEEGDYIFGAVSNSASVGGMNLFAGEEIFQNDGQMELLLIRYPRNLAEFNSIITALATKTPDNPYITYRQVKHARLVSDSDVEWTLDGEYGGAFKVTDISVINKAMTIMTDKN